jgi:hypothetical protein
MSGKKLCENDSLYPTAAVMRMHKFLPRSAVTGIGSLPHRDAAQAIRFVAEYSPEVPFWAQLPKRAPRENMIAQMLAPLWDLLEPQGPVQFEIKRGALDEFRRRLRESDAALQESSAAGFFEFEHACAANAFPHAVALKGQLTGPITLSRCLMVEGRALSFFPDMLIELTDYLSRLGVWQCTRLAQFGKPVVLFLDEPALGADAFLTDGILPLQCVIEVLRGAGATVGIHCCASTVPTALCRAQPDIISFDAHQRLDNFLSAPETRAFIQNGGWLCLGLVPTLSDLEEWSPLLALFQLLVAADSYRFEQLAAQSLITATCGLGLLTPEAAQQSFAKADELTHLIRQWSAETTHDPDAANAWHIKRLG